MGILQKSRLRFWDQFLEKAGEETKIFKDTSSSTKSHIKSGIDRINFVTCLSQANGGEAWVELCLESDKETNTKLFNALHEDKAEIEQRYGETLEWDGPKASRDRCKIMSRRFHFNIYDESSWPATQHLLIKMMSRLHIAITSSPDFPSKTR